MVSHQKKNWITVYSKGEAEIQPFPGIYDSALEPIIQEKIFGLDLSLKGMIEDVHAKEVISFKQNEESFINVNTQQDLEVLI